MVFVDPLMVCIPNPNWKWNKACHMFSADRDGAGPNGTIKHNNPYIYIARKAIAKNNLNVDFETSGKLWEKEKQK